MPLLEAKRQPVPREIEGGVKRHLTYNPDFDSEKYAALQEIKHEEPETYEQRKAMLDAETMCNIKTMLGERYNAGLSLRQDRLIDGRIYGAHSDEPLLSVYERGRDFRLALSSPYDQLREQAEIDGFLEVEAVLGDEQTPVGTMMVSFSPPGGEDSQYQHNFYDIFTLKEQDGKRYIESARYSSALTRQEYMTQATLLSPGYFKTKEQTDVPYDAYFLSHPLRIEAGENGISSATDLHRRLHKEHRVLENELYEAVVTACAPFLLAYLNVMATRPWAIEERNLTLNALLNASDQFEQRVRQKRDGWVSLYERQPTVPATPETIAYLGRQAVREVDTGCGWSGGFTVGAGVSEGVFGDILAGTTVMAPFSVAEFGVNEDKYGKRTFKCPHCSFENKRPHNQLIKYCQNTKTCGKDVSC